MKIKLTSPQVQNFIFLLDIAPQPLQDFYFENVDKVHKSDKKIWTIDFNTQCTKWLRKELKEYIETLREWIADGEDESKYHRIRIKKAERTIKKLK